jgi:hypothetical protein
MPQLAHVVSASKRHYQPFLRLRKASCNNAKLDCSACSLLPDAEIETVLYGDHWQKLHRSDVWTTASNNDKRSRLAETVRTIPSTSSSGATSSSVIKTLIMCTLSEEKVQQAKHSGALKRYTMNTLVQ